MKNYNPSHAPDAEAWLSLDESERLELVLNYHEEAGEEVNEDSERLHAVFHVVVENQLAMVKLGTRKNSRRNAFFG